MAELHKLYVHPKAQSVGNGFVAAHMALDHLFNSYGVKKVIVHKHGKSQNFWKRVAESYAERAVFFDPDCYFLAPGQLAEVHFPWAFDT